MRLSVRKTIDTPDNAKPPQRTGAAKVDFDNGYDVGGGAGFPLFKPWSSSCM
jgi:hypothetical protein